MHSFLLMYELVNRLTTKHHSQLYSFLDKSNEKHVGGEDLATGFSQNEGKVLLNLSGDSTCGGLPDYRLGASCLENWFVVFK